MDTYEALLASLKYVVTPTKRKASSTQKSKQGRSSNEIGRCYFEEVTPHNWINRPSSNQK